VGNSLHAAIFRLIVYGVPQRERSGCRSFIGFEQLDQFRVNSAAELACSIAVNQRLLVLLIIIIGDSEMVVGFSVSGINGHRSFSAEID